MSSDPGLVQRILDIIPAYLEPKTMFGGQSWMLGGNMCLGVYKDSLIVRVGVDQAEIILQDDHVRPMDLTGRVMKGWAMIAPDGLIEEDQLAHYCQLAIDFVSTLAPKE